MVLLLIAASRGQGDLTVSTDFDGLPYGVIPSWRCVMEPDRYAIGGASRKVTPGEARSAALYARPETVVCKAARGTPHPASAQAGTHVQATPCTSSRDAPRVMPLRASPSAARVRRWTARAAAAPWLQAMLPAHLRTTGLRPLSARDLEDLVSYLMSLRQ